MRTINLIMAGCMALLGLGALIAALTVQGASHQFFTAIIALSVTATIVYEDRKERLKEKEKQKECWEQFLEDLERDGNRYAEQKAAEIRNIIKNLE